MRTFSLISLTLLLAACGGNSGSEEAESKKTACDCAVEMNTNAQNNISAECTELRNDPAFDKAVVDCFFETIGMKAAQGDPGVMEYQDGTYEFDTDKATLVWKGTKFTGSEHYGNLGLKGGSFRFENGRLISGFIIVDMTSLTVSDLAGEKKADLEGHLFSGDFFDIDNHPTARFDITRVSEITAGNFALVGNLTIKGITQEYMTHVRISGEKYLSTVSGQIVFDRSKFDVRFGSNSFFDNLGDKAIRNEVIIKMILPATLTEAAPSTEKQVDVKKL
jgi:polyisoprenoid-binding protein YceI